MEPNGVIDLPAEPQLIVPVRRPPHKRGTRKGIIEVLERAQIDAPVVYALLWRGWVALAGLCSLPLIARRLTVGEQGFYYTFASIAASKVFFELGLGTVLTQYVSHERARLVWTAGILVGDQRAKERLGSLLRICLKWYVGASALMLLVVLPAGIVFFQHYSPVDSAVRWIVPWVGVIAGNAGCLLLTPLFALLDGCGRVADVSRVRLIDSVVSILVLWSALASGLGLMAAALFSLASFANQLLLLWACHRAFVADLLAARGSSPFSWIDDLWPLQWRIAVSWASGYFAFQLYSPVLFAYYGPASAGQMGLSVAALQGIVAISIAWVNTKAPLFGALIAQQRFAELDGLFRGATRRSVMVALTGCLAFLLATAALQIAHHPLGTRILGPLPLLFLIGSSLINVTVYARAMYLRAHKQEPFLTLSVVHGIANACVVYVFGRYFGAAGMVTATFCVTAYIGWWSGRVFKNKRHVWHTVPLSRVRTAESVL